MIELVPFDDQVGTAVNETLKNNIAMLMAVTSCSLGSVDQHQDFTGKPKNLVINQLGGIITMSLINNYMCKSACK